MKEKLKKFFNKDRIFVFICLLCIIVFCVLYAILYCNDKKQVSENKSTIILNEDENLNISGSLFSIDITNYSFIYDYSLESVTSTSSSSFDYLSCLGVRYVDLNIPIVSYNLSYDFFCIDVVNFCNASGFKTLSYQYIFDSQSIDFNSINFYMLNPNIVYYFDDVSSQGFDFSKCSRLLDDGEEVFENTNVESFGFNYVINVLDYYDRGYKYLFLACFNYEEVSSSSDTSSLQVNNYFVADDFNNTLGFGASSEQYNTLLSQYNILNSQYNSLNAQFSTLNSQYTNLLSQYNILNNSNTSLNAQYDSLVASKNALQSQYDSLVASKNTLQSQYDTLFASYSSLSASNSDLQSEMHDLLDEYNSIQVNYDILESNYNSLLSMYNNLTTDKYTFTELFWSISAVPFGILTSGFNVNVLGFNLAAIITGLFTSLLLIWLIKKFFK